MIRNPVIEIEPTEPPIREVHLDLLAKPPLGTDAIAIADNQHSDHEFRIDRGSANIAVKGFKLLAELRQNPRHHRIDTAQQMARRNAFFEVEKIK